MSDDDYLNSILSQLDLDDGDSQSASAAGGGVMAPATASSIGSAASPNKVVGARDLVATLSQQQGDSPAASVPGLNGSGSATSQQQQQPQVQQQIPAQQPHAVQQVQGQIPQQFMQQQQQQPQGMQQVQQVGQQQQWQQQQQQPPPPPGMQYAQQQQMMQQPQQQPGGTTVFMNGQYYQVPPGMQLAQVSANGFQMAAGQTGGNPQPQLLQQPPAQQQQQPMVMQMGPNGQLQPAPQQQYAQQQQQQQQQVTAQQQQQQAQVLTVPAGMSVEQFIAQLQSQGLSGQVLNSAPQQQQQGVQQQQQQAPAPQYQHQPPGQPSPSWAKHPGAPQQQVQQQQQQQGQHRYQTQQHPAPQGPRTQQPQGLQSAPQQPSQAVKSLPPSESVDSKDDLTRLNATAKPFNPKATAFIPKDTESASNSSNNTNPSVTAATTISPSGAAAVAAPVAKKEPGVPIACPHCTDTGFLTEYVLRSHIKAKHSTEHQVGALGAAEAGGGVAATAPVVGDPPQSVGSPVQAGPTAAEAAPTAVTALLDLIKDYLQTQCKSGSCSLDALTTYLDTTHAVAMGEASSVVSFAEILHAGGIRRFSYTADELHRAGVRAEVAVATESRVALPNVDYMANDTTRSKEI